MVGENMHFAPGFAAARAYLRDGAIGAVRQVTMSARGYRRPSGWRSRREEMGGGLLIDAGIHYLHLLRAWIGPVDEVMAMAPPRLFVGLEGEDTSSCSSDPGTEPSRRWPTPSPRPGCPRWQSTWVTGADGSLGVDHRGRAVWLRAAAGTRARLFVRDRRGLVAQLAEFVAAVREGRPPAFSPESARADLELVLAAYRSLETGRPAAPGTRA